MSEVKEHPILFSGEMVRAILNGSKTMTRRIIKPQPEYVVTNGGGKVFGLAELDEKDRKRAIEALVKDSPYQVGDRLWVRETWGGLFFDGKHILQHRDVPKELRTQENCRELFYRASDDDEDYPGCWVPSIFMYRWASRITLEVTGVRVERVNQISREDCFAEGIGRWTEVVEESSFGAITPEDEFARLWDSINGDGSFQGGDWVWVVSFRRGR